jgi:hypothetical protein
MDSPPLPVALSSAERISRIITRPSSARSVSTVAMAVVASRFIIAVDDAMVKTLGSKDLCKRYRKDTKMYGILCFLGTRVYPY